MPLFVSEEIKNIINEDLFLEKNEVINNLDNNHLMSLIIKDAENSFKAKLNDIKFLKEDYIKFSLKTNLNVSNIILKKNNFQLNIGEKIYELENIFIEKIKYINKKEEYLLKLYSKIK